MFKTKFTRTVHLLLLLFLVYSELKAGEPVCHIMICCKACNNGVTFLVNGQWRSSHDYSDINQARDILQKIKDAGINTVSIDMTNPSQWTVFWDAFEPMVNNVQQVCREKNMQFFIFIGGQLPENIKTECNIPSNTDAFQFWNNMAEKIWSLWAQDPTYRKYGYGDDRPLLLAFLPAQSYWSDYNSRVPEFKTYLSKYHIGTTQVNDPITPQESDGWGYRNYSQNPSGSVRFASPNGGVNPNDPWYKVSVEEWRRRVEWVSEATEYSVYGSYDDTCDGIQWGISNTKSTSVAHNRYPGDDPWIYYNIVKQKLNPRGKDISSFEFNTSGDTENWTGNNQAGEIIQSVCQDGTEGVLKSASGVTGTEPALSFNNHIVLPAEYRNWGEIEIRMRQLVPTGTGSQIWDPSGTSFHIQYNNGSIASEINAPAWTIDFETAGDWIMAKTDISPIGADTINGLIIVPVEDTELTGKNFEIDFIRLTGYLKMEVPVGFSAIAGDGVVSLDWADNTEPALEQYKLYRSAMSGGPYILITEGPVSSYQDSTVVNDSIYYYAVTAVDILGNETGLSREVTAMPREIGLYAYRWDFNTSDDLEGWSGNEHVGGLLQSTGLDGQDGILKSANGVQDIDPRISLSGAISLPAIYKSWNEIEIRVRQIGADGLTPQAFDPQGTIGYFLSPDSYSPGEIKTPAWRIIEEQEDYWISARADISILAGKTITLLFVDPIGNAPGIGKNFELDYVYLTAILRIEVPSGLIATSGDGVVSLDWDDVTNKKKFGHFKIYRGLKAQGPYTCIDSTTKSEFTDSSAINDIRYYYKLSTVDTSRNESDLCNLVTAKPTRSALSIKEFEAGSVNIITKIYPNPFTSQTTIEYFLSEPGKIKIEVFNVSGRIEIVLIDAFQTAGTYSIDWNGKNDAGYVVPEGIYFSRMAVNDFIGFKRMMKISR